MAEISLSQRIKAEFDARARRAKESEEARAQEAQVRDQRMVRFNEVCEKLKGVWRPRFEEFAKQFGEQVKITPTVTPGHREARVSFMTNLATVTLTVTASTSSEVTNFVLDYDLSIIPIFFEYERHSRLEMPLENVDAAAVGRWLDDRLVSCVKTYLTMQENEYYIRRAMVEDPITKSRFLPADACATLTHGGRTVYFDSEESMAQYKQKQQITG